MVHVIKAVCALRPATESDGMARQECSLLPGCCGPLDAVKNASRFIGRSYAVCWASSKSLKRRSNSGVKLKRCDEGAWFPGSFDMKAVTWPVAYWHFFYFIIFPSSLIYLFIYFLLVIQVNTTWATMFEYEAMTLSRKEKTITFHTTLYAFVYCRFQTTAETAWLQLIATFLENNKRRFCDPLTSTFVPLSLFLP